MKKWLLLFFFLLSFSGQPLIAWAGDFPLPQGAVNDFAGVIDPSYRRMMVNIAEEVLTKTGFALVVVTVETIGDNTVEDYANRLYEAWGIGKKGEDKGVLIFLALKERKVRIETGYGAEGILPDGLVGEILDRYAIPYLRAGEYGKGLTNAVAAVAEVIARDAHVEITGIPKGVSARPRNYPLVLNKWIFIILIPLFLILMATRRGRELLFWLLFMSMMGGGRGGGGGFGGFGGGSSGGGGASRDF